MKNENEKNNIRAIFGSGLAARVAVYIPSTTDATKAAPELAEKMTAKTAAAFSDLFGGATATTARGFWNSADAGLIAEAVTIVYSNTTPEQIEKHAADIKRIAEAVRDGMTQEAVSVEINGTLYFI